MAVLVLSGLLLGGMGFRYMHHHTRDIPADAYSEVDSLLRQGSDLGPTESLPRSSGSGAGSDKPENGLLPAVEVIDLNTATAVELERLPRIGPKLAARIIAYREAHGPFEDVRDLTRVTGIGEKTFLRLESLVYASSGK